MTFICRVSDCRKVRLLKFLIFNVKQEINLIKQTTEKWKVVFLMGGLKNFLHVLYHYERQVNPVSMWVCKFL